MAATYSSLSKTTIISLAVMLSATIALPLVKRDTIKIGNKGWYLDMTAADQSAWANSVSTVCSKTSDGVCIGESVVATLLTALMALGNTGATGDETDSETTTEPSSAVGYTNGTNAEVVPTDGTTTLVPAASSSAALPATTTSAAHQNLLSQILKDAVAVPSEIAHTFEDAGLKLLGVYNMTHAAQTLNNIQKAVQNTTKTIDTDIKSKISQAVHNAENGADSFKDRLESAVQHEASRVKSKLEADRSRVHAIATKVAGDASNVVGDIKSEASKVASGAKAVESSVKGKVESDVEQAVERAQNAVDTVLHFNSSLGQHLVTAIGNTNLTELAELVTNAIPGVPTFKQLNTDVENTVENIADKVKAAAKNSVSDLQSAVSNLENKVANDRSNIQGAIDNVKTIAEAAAKNVEAAAQNTTKNAINWISYNIQHTDEDISDVISHLPTFNATRFSSEISNFVDNLGDFKFCLSPSTGYNLTYSSPKTIFGEVYFNTYGGVDNECQ
ncbi:hypothetical protein DAKH74_048910 [Maudiozyma humilis]|uniref:Uncharacterized protein n=1 Tax=Maudiozyma humilis TaxID=51915 RepID=A0AAV5S3I0_MAUHU|nr:hypothetical protein DAKH74_048910 [Kazachstania humilis]